ncbi:anti-sigma factor [Salibacterium salarium]|uniref:Anti-sigma factor n=1 Tax=Salibacterium salarium TaxID=284579 RepID=A0A428MSZ6_9BACI|nr:zf-HC2 domain-containing protein [Salibacterium salarium]RSL29253.1 anti-sigma factor [Salibacterium salarium]
MACEQKYEALLNRYLDGETNEQERDDLFLHMETCENCTNHYKELNKALLLVQSSSHIKAPAGFTDNVMNQLPAKKKRTSWKKWSKQHPVLVAASLFVILMTSSLFSVWNEQAGEEISVSGSQKVEVDQDKGTVVVPEEEVIEGDLTVRNGKVEVEGEITGNLTVINGEQYLASAGEVSGEIEEVDQVLEWIWYHTKRITADVFSLGENAKKNEG